MRATTNTAAAKSSSPVANSFIRRRSRPRCTSAIATAGTFTVGSGSAGELHRRVGDVEQPFGEQPDDEGEHDGGGDRQTGAERDRYGRRVVPGRGVLDPRTDHDAQVDEGGEDRR